VGHQEDSFGFPEHGREEDKTTCNLFPLFKYGTHLVFKAEWDPNALTSYSNFNVNSHLEL
jgi:hypothetical protein